MKEYTPEEKQEISRKINELIMVHDRWEIIELCQSEEYALRYFVNKALEEISTLEHIRRAIERR
jgi:recombinational DNA repair protein RecR